ncbi:MAG: hypothetical protein QM820_65600 [Minicystis sp.]
MNVNLRIVNAATRTLVHQQIVTLEHGGLGNAIHTAVAEIYAEGSIPGAGGIEEVAAGTVPLPPSCTVGVGGISTNSGVVVAAQSPAPNISVHVAFSSVDEATPSLLDRFTQEQTIGVSSSLDEILILTSEEMQRAKLPTREPPLLALTYPGWYEGIENAETMVQAPQQSGDRYAVAVALRIHPEMVLKIVWDDHFYLDKARAMSLPVTGREARLRGLTKARAEELRAFYSECGIEWARISLQQVDDVEHAVSRKKTTFHDVWFASDATRMVATQIGKMNFPSFCNRYGVPGLTSGLTMPAMQRIKALVNNHLLATVDDEKRPVVFLFLRNSGIQPGGAHPELDTYKSIVAQIVGVLRAQGERCPYIHVVGDKLFKNMVYFNREPPEGKEWKLGVTNMMRWWDPEDTWLWVRGESRRLTLCEQLYAFHCLHEALGKRLVLIGMRSGMLEAPAYMGITTIYLDYKNSGGYERMLVLAGDEKGNPYRGSGVQAFQGVKIPNYHLLCISPVNTDRVELRLGEAKKRIECLKRIRRLLKGGHRDGSLSLRGFLKQVFNHNLTSLVNDKKLLAALNEIQLEEITLKIEATDTELKNRALGLVNELLQVSYPYLDEADTDRLLQLIYE